LSRSQAHDSGERSLALFPKCDTKGATKIDDSHDSADMHKNLNKVLQ
jgi:hypothetical protein